MTKPSAVRRLETVIDKLSHLNVQIEGTPLHQVIRQVADVRDRVSAGQLDIKKPFRKKSVRSKIKKPGNHARLI